MATTMTGRCGGGGGGGSGSGGATATNRRRTTRRRRPLIFIIIVIDPKSGDLGEKVSAARRGCGWMTGGDHLVALMGTDLARRPLSEA